MQGAPLGAAIRVPLGETGFEIFPLILGGAEFGWHVDMAAAHDILDAHRERGGNVTELVMEGVGHSPHLERPAEFRRALLTRIGYIGLAQHPAPPTEAIIISSSD